VAGVLTGGLVSCASAQETVTGIVVEVEGDLTTVSRFVLVLPDGTRPEFVPSPGILFHDRAPISHLQDHLRSGAPVELGAGDVTLLDTHGAERLGSINRNLHFLAGLE